MKVWILSWLCIACIFCINRYDESQFNACIAVDSAKEPKFNEGPSNFKTLSDLSRALEDMRLAHLTGQKGWDAAAGLITEQLAESFLARFLDTRRIEDFVKTIPQGKESLQVFSTLSVSGLGKSHGVKLNAGVREEFIVGLGNVSTSNSSIIVFGIISHLVDIRNPKDIWKTNKPVTYSLEIMPGHEATILYPITFASGSLENRHMGLEIIVHYMDKASKQFGKASAKIQRIELRNGPSVWLDWQLIFIVIVSCSFLVFLSWLVLQATLKPRKKYQK